MQKNDHFDRLKTLSAYHDMYPAGNQDCVPWDVPGAGKVLTARASNSSRAGRIACGSPALLGWI